MRESTGNPMSIPELYTAEHAVNELLEAWQELRCIARRGQYNRQAPPPVPHDLTAWRGRMLRRLTVLRPSLESARDAVTVARQGKPLEIGYRIEASAVSMVLKVTDQLLERLRDLSV